MRSTVILVLVAALLGPAAEPARAQARSDRLDALSNTFRSASPKWRFYPGICTCTPLVPEETGVLTGIWYLSAQRRRARAPASLTVHEIDNAQVAHRWIDGMGRGNVASGWTVQPITRGEEGYLLSFEGGKAFAITFRSGNLIVRINGDLRADVEEIATLAEHALK